MAAIHPPHPLRDHPNATRGVLDALWALALGLIAAYAFFVVLGAFDPGEVPGITVTVGMLLALCVLRIAVERRGRARPRRDPTATHARERRGF
ncbi:MAG TPA: hypothetical protein VFT50_12340 [Baekduia sp.]|nr:hypothetical protein [Baekduia sp.]